ncbi:MAG: class I SAM-dependent methyltransferase [Rubricoccaceae bacterium]|nr:class I SAM-dependent methyltransferase [Rubricoccaceae bacterium]
MDHGRRTPDDREAAPYSRLAEGYDAVMSYVDYAAWAEYVQFLLERHHPAARDVLELGCGTGTLALALQPLGSAGGYRYRATDASEAMLAVARRKAEAAGVPIRFAPADFRDLPPGPPADAVLLLYDGFNYLLDPRDVARLFRSALRALRPGGVFVVDQSTPVNSLNHPDGFDDAGATGAFTYRRTSRYDPETRRHTTRFRLETAGGDVHEETHVQRAYTRAEVEPLARAAGFAVEAAYDGFSDDPAGDTAERIHWVLRKPPVAA